MAIITVRQQSAAKKRKIDLREKFWPGVTEKNLWDRQHRDGFGTIPRAMPQMLSIMNDLAEKGQPVGSTYLELWCRLGDESFLNLNRPHEMASAAGFGGQRAVYTWRDRLSKLRELGFIDFKDGPAGEFSYGLFWNPYHVIRRHYDGGRVSDAKWQALVFRAHEIGANDLDENIPADPNKKRKGSTPE